VSGIDGSRLKDSFNPNSSATPQQPLIAIVAILLGIAINLVVSGYQFGLSNHSVYLIDALRKNDPGLLANDWFYTQTLQYHSAFGWMTAGLLRTGLLEPAFALIYAMLLVVFHVSWRGIVQRLGGGNDAYLLSVVLYFISAGGIGLGTYQFFQDSCVLASNIANVAMFAGAAAFIHGRLILAGMCLGVSGLFHLNHAVVVPVLWLAISLYENRLAVSRWLRPIYLTATTLAAVGCAVNVIPSAMAKLSHPGHPIPLEQFVDWYAALRHPHHYHPASWPWVIWLAFCFWIPPGLVGMSLIRTESRDRTAAVLLSILVLQVIALCFAGLWYVSETLVQMSLFRFSIIVHLLLVVFAAVLMTRWKAMVWALPACLIFAAGVLLLSPFTDIARARAGSIIMLVAMGFAPMVVLLSRKRAWPAIASGMLVTGLLLAGFDRITGLSRPLVKVDEDYRALCAWVADSRNTDPAGVFLVSPVDEDFRWFAKRAIVINWKSVPQLAGELPEWHARMAAALGWETLDALPRGSYLLAQDAMRSRYEKVDGSALFTGARRYGAQYVVAVRSLGSEFEPYRVGPAFGRYLLYKVSR